MRIPLRLAPLALLMALPLAAAAQAPDPAPSLTPQQIEQFVKQLDSNSFRERQAAERQLQDAGEAARPFLEKALQSDSLEQIERARKLLRELNRSLRVLSVTQNEALNSVTSVTVHGQFVYTAAWEANAVSVFRLDEQSGQLAHVQSLSNAEDLGGAVALRLSGDGKWAAVACFQAKTVVLFQRDATSGKLTQVAVARKAADGQSLVWPIELAFAPQAAELYVLDARLPHAEGGGRGALVTYDLSQPGQLKWKQTLAGDNNCFNECRGLAVDPRGDQLYVASDTANSLVRVTRSADNGSLQIAQVLLGNRYPCLQGAFSVCLAPDNAQHVYVSSGRFRGTNAISFWKRQADGSLTLGQQITDGTNQLRGFRGGNELLVSPDGKHLYAAATRSSRLVAFQRDAGSGELRATEHLSWAPENGSPAGVATTPDGKLVLVALEGVDRIAVCQRHAPLNR